MKSVREQRCASCGSRADEQDDPPNGCINQKCEFFGDGEIRQWFAEVEKVNEQMRRFLEAA